MTTLHGRPRPASGLGGFLLDAGTHVTALVRRAGAPPPQGALLRGILRREGSAVRTGISWLDDAGETTVLVGVSRALGLLPTFPDVIGLTIRLGTADDPVDLLLASAGMGRLSRFAPVPRWSPGDGPLTTVLPLRSPTGPLLVAAEPLGWPRSAHGVVALADTVAMTGTEPLRLRLSHATLAGAWRPFGTLDLTGRGRPQPDAIVRFGLPHHAPAGLEGYAWSRQLRRRTPGAP